MVIYPCLFVSYRYLSVSAGSYRCLSVSAGSYRYLSVSAGSYRYLSIPVRELPSLVRACSWPAREVAGACRVLSPRGWVPSLVRCSLLFGASPLMSPSRRRSSFRSRAKRRKWSSSAVSAFSASRSRLLKFPSTWHRIARPTRETTPRWGSRTTYADKIVSKSQEKNCSFFLPIQNAGDVSTHPSLRASPDPNPAPTETLDLTQGSVGVSPDLCSFHP